VQIALDDHVSDSRHAALLHRRNALRPRSSGRVGILCRRVREDERADQRRIPDGQPLPDHATHRKADPHDGSDFPVAHHARSIVDEVVHRVRAGRSGRCAVATVVIAEHAMARRQRCSQIVPHCQVEAQRVAQHHRRASFTFENDMQR
jgi:hypothetical protein